MIGDSFVGKTSLVCQFVDGVYTETAIPTINVDYKTKIITHHKKEVKVNVWDTAGQEKFKTITSGYYRDARGVVFVYDVSNPESFAHVNNWVDEVSRYAHEDCQRLVLGNKSDLPPAVPTAQAKAYAEGIGALFYECSAKTSERVDEAFLGLVTSILQYEQPSAKQGIARVDIKAEKGGCC